MCSVKSAFSCAPSMSSIGRFCANSRAWALKLGVVMNSP
jgi:hypothetical protein